MTAPAGTHGCLACHYAKIPIYRAFCGNCWPKVPWQLRAEVMHAYRARAYRRAPYDAKLIELQQWKNAEIERGSER